MYLGDWYGLSTTGAVCEEGLCVECVSDVECEGRDRVCDPTTLTCVDTSVDPQHTKIGIFYFLWHCPASEHVRDLSVLSPDQWGPYGSFHYWGRPAAGYYCLSRDDGTLQSHAQQLRDAGIDFVFLDVTNHAYVDGRSDRTPQMILEPLDRLLAVWSQVEGAPQVVPWVPVVEPNTDPGTNTVDAILQRLAAYSGMHFEFDGKPLILVTDNAQYVPNEAKLASLSTTYTIRKMWALYAEPGPRWSFLQPCRESPLNSAPCAQRSAELDGRVEQVSISVAYQATYMSVDTATPKYGGETFRKQFQTLFDNPQADIATITGWNEWIAQRQPCSAGGACDCATSPNGCFIDTWDSEYNRDIEPADMAGGDASYRLLGSCIEVFRRGEVCDASNAGELCCQ